MGGVNYVSLVIIAYFTLEQKQKMIRKNKKQAAKQ